MRRSVIAAVALLGACRTSGSGGGSRSVVVTAFGGDLPEPGALVIGHSPDGQAIDQTNADAVGRAVIRVDDDSLISVVFPGTFGATTSVISVVTVPVPLVDPLDLPPPTTAIDVHGPPPARGPSLVVGVLQVDGPPLANATYFDIQLGCATVRVTSLPAALDVASCNLGSDVKLDVLVTGHHDLGGDPPAPQLDGYAAARVALTNGIATLTIPAWETTASSLPVLRDGVDPVVQVEWFSDGLSFGSQLVTDAAPIWNGLVIDATRITAALAGTGTAQVTTRETVGDPGIIDLADTDFLRPIALSTTLVDLSPATFAWDPDYVGDAVNLHATWSTDEHRVIWDAVLPIGATGVTLPTFSDDIASAIEPRSIDPVDVVLRYVDSDHHEGFAALLAAGVHAEETVQPSTIAPRPTDGEIRVSHAIGLR